jgi:hypothetical protein
MSSRKLVALATALGCLALPAPLLAQDLTSSGERIVSDPTYLPLKGQVEGETIYEYQSSSSTTSGGGAGSFTASTLSQEFEYGLLDDLTIGVNDDYGWVGNHTVSPTGRSSSAPANGFADPTFGVTWRVLDQRRQQPLDLDLGVAYAPNLIRAIAPTPTQEGNFTGGGDDLTLHAALGWETKSLTLQGYFNESLFGNTKVYEPKGYSAAESRWQPVIGLNTQMRFTPRLSVNVDGSYTFQGTANVFDTANGVSSVHDTGNYGIVGASVNYHFILNKLVGSLGYNHTFYGQTNVVYPLHPAADLSEQRASDALTAAMSYVFW